MIITAKFGTQVLHTLEVSEYLPEYDHHTQVWYPGTPECVCPTEHTILNWLLPGYEARLCRGYK